MQELRDRNCDAIEAKAKTVAAIQEHSNFLQSKLISKPLSEGNKANSTPLQSTSCTSEVSSLALEHSQPKVAKYESRDHNGRVWGVPSAFGRGQCLSCPKKASPPSMRCVSCQLVMAQSEPMSADDVRKIQNSLNGLLRKMSGRMCNDIAQRLDQLYSKLETGLIPQSIQSALLTVVESLSKNNAVAQANDTEAASLVAKLTAEHWVQHKEWLVGLKRLIYVQEAQCKPMTH